MEGTAMNESEPSRYSPAGKIANERFIGAVLEREEYPDGTAFLPFDAPDFAELLAASVAEHRPVAVIYPDGREFVATPAVGALAAVLVILLRLLSSRRERNRLAHSPRADWESVSVALPRDYEVEFREREPAAAA